MLKTTFKYFTALSCGLMGLLLLLYFQPAVPQTAYARTLDNTPTPPATNPTMRIDTNTTGHSGTSFTVTGSGFKVAQDGNTVSLYVTTDPNKCTFGSTPNDSDPHSNFYDIAPPPNNVAHVDANGAFSFQVRWPQPSDPNTGTSAPNDPGGEYYVCGLSTQNEKAVSQNTFRIAEAVTIDVAPTTANPGDSITVTGTHWVPVQQLKISIISASNPDQPIATQTVDATQISNTGAFTANITLNATAAAGPYSILVETPNDPQGPKFKKDNVLTINAPVTPTPSPTPSPSPSPTETATATPVPSPTSSNNGGSNTGSGGGGSTTTIIIFVLGGMGVLMVLIGLIMFAVSSPTSTRPIS